MRGWVALLVVAGCSASGSENTTHGPVFDDDFDAGSDSGASVDATVGADAAEPDASGEDAAMAPDGADGATSDAAILDSSTPVDAPVDAPPCTSTTALIAGSTTSLAGAIVMGTSPSSLQAVTGTLGSAPAIAALAGRFQALASESGGALASSAASAAAWGAFAPLTGNPASIGAPAVAPLGTSLHAAYLGTNHLYYHAIFNGTSWDSGSDPIGPNADAAGQAFGPAAPSAASVAGSFVVAYQGNDNLVHVQSWAQASGWDEGVQVGTDTVAANEPVAMVALAGGTHDLLVVYEKSADTKLYSFARAAASKAWTAGPTLVNATAFTHDAPTLAAISGGRAVLAWHGTDGPAYTSVYTDATGAWTAPAPLVAGTNPTVTSAPSLATGVCGDDAVAAFVSSGAVSVTRSNGGAWLAPTTVTGVTGATFVTVATAP